MYLYHIFYSLHAIPSNFVQSYFQRVANDDDSTNDSILHMTTARLLANISARERDNKTRHRVKSAPSVSSASAIIRYAYDKNNDNDTRVK